MFDIETCIKKLNAIKDIIGNGDNLFDSIIYYLKNTDSRLSLDNDTCRYKYDCLFFSTYKEGDKKIERNSRIKSDAFRDENTEYYKLLVNIGDSLKAGSIFYYDPDDDIRGSIAAGCLKLAWKDGNCQNNLCADTVVFHANFREDKRLFKKVDRRR